MVVRNRREFGLLPGHTVMRIRRMVAIGAAVLMAVLGAVIPLPTSARADDANPLVRSLVLGDSFSSGVGGDDYEPGPCVVSPNSYAAQWVKLARQRGVNAAAPVNHACFGAETKHFDQAQGEVDEQMSFINHTYDIVFVTIGGNDLGFADLAGKCLVGRQILSKQLGCEDEFWADEAKINATLKDKIKDLLVRVADNLHDGARVVYMGTPH